MADTEEYFPRGGKKPTFKDFKQTSNFLGDVEKGERKKKRPTRKAEGDDGYLSAEVDTEFEQSTKNCAVGLSYQSVKEGLLILGRVSRVLETKVLVSLPNRMYGCVMACHISEAFNKLLEAYVADQIASVRPLSSMFRPGQYIACKVLEVQADTLMLSMMPQHLHSGRSHQDLQKGALLQAAVSSVEDHGFVMDLGIPNTRAFLPKTNTSEEVELDHGVLTWCAVKSIAVSPEASVVTLSNELTSLQRACKRKPPRGVAGLTPGAPVEFIVDKALENGIEGHMFDGITGYVQRQHADTLNGKKPALGQRVQAYLLYEMPTRKSPFLTLRSVFESTYPDLATEQKFQEGDIVENAQVIKVSYRSVVFRLRARCVGTMSLKRVRVDENMTDEEVVAKSYPLGSEHKVRILTYNLSDYCYSVSDSPDVLRLRVMSVRQLSAGELVSGTVAAVKDSMLVVQVDRVQGVVPHAHMTDAGVYINPKKPTANKLPNKMFKIGQPVSARVIRVKSDNGTLVLTLKPSLLAEDLEVLKSYEDAAIGKGYTGAIKYIADDYILVSFFGDVIAYVRKQYVTKVETDDLREAFHVGQIVNCTILKVDPEAKKMVGSLTTTPFWPNKKLERGEKRTNTEMGNSEEPTKKRKISEESEAESGKAKKKKEKKPAPESEEEETEPIQTKKKKEKTKQAPEIGQPEDLEVLKSYEDAAIGKGYTGAIKYIADDYILVSFVGDVIAYVRKQYATKVKTDDLREAFHVGQIVNCTITKVDPEAKKMVGSLTTTPFWPNKKLERGEKRKNTEMGNSEEPTKKRKISEESEAESGKAKKKKEKKPAPESEEEETEPIQTKKKKEKTKQAPEVTESESVKTKTKKGKIPQPEPDTEVTETEKKNKRKKQKEKKDDRELTSEVDNQQKHSEESDAIETDFQDEEVLTPQDVVLIDMSGCITKKNFKKRVASIRKALTARAKRIDTIEKKIKATEKDIYGKNKKYLPAMHSEIIIIEKRIKHLEQALKRAQEKLKEFPEDELTEYQKQKLEEAAAKKDKKTTNKKQKNTKSEDNEQKPSKKNKPNTQNKEDKKLEKIKEKAAEDRKKDKIVKEKVKEIKIADCKAVLEVPSVKDFWSTDVSSPYKPIEKEDDLSSSDEEKQEQPKKKRKKLTVAEKVAKAREEEERLRELERLAIESASRPQSVEQFERALLASPDSSQLWIAYMAFHLQATEIEKARAVGRKAIATISFREEQEKLNVWLAMLNFEHRFGNKETQQATLEEALQLNDTYSIHSKLLDIFTDTASAAELASLVDLMLRKYRRQTPVYAACAAACYKLGLVEKARQVMQKAIGVLEKKEHVAVLVQFALLERDSGERERAEALFEQVLGVYPGRVDVCAAYVDMLLKEGDAERVRQVMERMTSQKLPARKMKILYKKWIEVEEKIGDESQVERIRHKAMEFIENAKF